MNKKTTFHLFRISSLIFLFTVLLSIQAFAQIDISTVAYWKFNEANGVTSVSDETTNNLDGTFTGAGLAYGASTAFSSAGNALGFTDSGYVTVPNNVVINTMQNSMTIEAWIYQTDNANNTIVDRGNYNFLFQSKPNGQPGLGFYNFSGGWTYSTSSLPVNTWVHVAMTWDDATKTVKFYTNGVLTDTITRPLSLTFNNSNLNIGRQDPDGCKCNVMDGNIDELRLSNVVRTQTEIQAMMNIGDPPVITLTGANPQIINVGTAYSELNATASDTTDGDISGNIIIDASAVDVNKAGSYTVTYNITDSDGNVATEVTRTVDLICDLDIQATATNVSCINGSDGSVVLTPSGGTAPYTFGQTTFEDDFSGGINFANYSSNTMTANDNGNELELTPTSGWTSDFLSNQTFTREDGLTFEGSIFIPYDGYKAVMVGFNDDAGNGTSSVSHGVYFFDNGSSADVDVTARFGANANAFPTGSYANTTSPGNWFDFKIVLDGTDGATYSVKKSTDATYTNTFTSNSGNLTTFKIGVNSNNGGSTVATLHKNWRVYRAPNATSNLTAGIYTYFVRDANGCTDDVTVQVATEVDSVNPVVSLVGADNENINLGETYNDPGATATDNCGVFGAIVTSGTINNAVVGAYTLTYTAKDEFLNEGSITRTVNVIDNVAPTAVAQDITVQLDASGNAIITTSQINNGSSDNVTSNANLTLAIDKTTFDCDDVGQDCGVASLNFGAGTYAGNANGPKITDISDAGFTLEAWIKPTAISVGANSVVRKDGDYNLYLNNGIITADVWNDSDNLYTLTGAAINANVWTHVALVWDGSSGTFYLNGSAVSSAINNRGVSVFSSSFDLGRSSIYGQEFFGNIDDVRLWSDVRTATEINDNYTECLVGSENNLELYYKTLAGAGNILKDFSPNGFDATIVGAIWSADAPPLASTEKEVILTVTDEAGNSSTAIANVTVEDNINPTITLNGNTTYTIEIGDSFTDLGATPADNCAVSVITIGSVDQNTVGVYTITYKAKDSSGNESATLTRTVNIVDTTDPIITLLGANPQVLEVEDAYSELGANANDNHYGPITPVVIDASNVVAGTIGSYTVTYNIDDQNSNAADQVVRTVNVVDTTPPTAIAVAGPININLNTTTSITPQDVDNGSFDNYGAGGITLSLDKSTFSCDDVVAGQVTTPVTVTLTVKDSSDNTATTTVVVNVIDDVAPANVALVNPTYVHPTGTPYVEQGFTQDEVCLDGYTIVSSDLDVNQWGTYTIVYKVLDKSGNESAEITRTQVVNNVPTTDTANYTVNQDTENHIFDVLDGDSFGPDGPESFTISGAMSAQNGTLILNDQGTSDPTDDTVTYSPFATYNGPDSFSYTIEDENGDTATQIVNITVRPIVPVPLDDAVTVDKNSTNNDPNNYIAVLANDDFGGNGANLTHSLTFTNGSKVSASVNGGYIGVFDNNTINDYTDDTILYFPPLDFVGVDSFMYTITDLDGDATNATVTITVVEGANGNSTPTALDDTATVHAGSTMNIIDVLDNDTPGTDDYIANGLTLTNGTSLGASTEGGIINVDNKGTVSTLDDEFLYSAPSGFDGTDTFMYTITDSSGDASSATVTVTVNAVTDVPSAVSDAATTVQDTSVIIDILGNGDTFGTDGPALVNPIVLSVSPTANGGVIIVNDNTLIGDPSDDDVTYTPTNGFIGTDTFGYTLTDGTGDTSVATVTVTVNGLVVVNGEPTAQPDAVTVAQNSASNVINVLDDNGSGADSYGTDGANTTHPLTFSNGSTTSASLEGGAIAVVGSTVEYTPPTDFSGSDSFDYVITDLNGDASRTTVSITITGSALVSTPTASDDTASVAYGSVNNPLDVLVNDNFGLDGPITGGGLTMTNGTLVSASTNGGAISITANMFYYSAPAGFSGDDTFMYTITDDSGDASSATVTVTVGALVVDAPTAVDDSFGVAEDSSNNDLAILSNGDSFGDDGSGSITLSGATSLEGGSIVINENGTPLVLTDDTVTYTPPASFVGTDSFTYTLEDGNTDTAIATVTITVGVVVPPATVPTAVDDNASVPRFSMNNLIDVMANDDFGADLKNLTHPLTLSNGRSTGTSSGGRFIQVHDSGTPTDYSDDTVSYSPGSLLTDSFEYTITDGNGDAATGTVYITTTSIKSGESISVGSNTIFENNFLAYPNPSRGNIKTTLLSAISTKATIFLSDVTGKIIERRVLDLKKGVNQLEFDFNMKSGLMLMKIMSSEVDYGTSKIVFK